MVKSTIPKARSIRASVLEVDDLAGHDAAEGHRDEPDDDHEVAGAGGPERAQVGAVDQRDHEREGERHAHEDVGRGATHCGQRSHLARELHATAHGVGDHVEDLREEPPTWRWMLTASTTNSKFFEPSRSAIDCRASSAGRPSRVSVSTRWNSLEMGSGPSRESVDIACWNDWPARSDEATAVSVSPS